MSLYVWGSDSSGELGLGGSGVDHDESVDSPHKMQWDEAANLKKAALGGQHTLLLTNAGKIFSCGNNDYGQLGQDVSRKRPQLVSTLDNYNITQVACGSHHSLAVNEWGQLFSWGSNSFGQCGHENESSSNYHTPKIVKSLATKHVVQISCGQFHSLVLTNSGEIYVFGSNVHGQLGLGFESEKVSKPTLIKSLLGLPAAYICSGGNHSFVLTKSGAVYGFGKNLYGQLGVNDQFSKCHPTQLRTLRNIGVKYITCGDDFSVFLTRDGGVFTCGAGAFGQLGHGNYSNEILPRKVLELMGSTVTQISCGRRHTLTFVPSRRRVYGFGLGGSGQLGSGKDFTKSSIPHIVNGPWVSESTGLQDNSDLMIKCIYAGGDHCLVSLYPHNSQIVMDDFRMQDDATQIWIMTKELAEHCSKLEPSESVDIELITTVEVVFKSLACYNSSFLSRENNNFLPCTSKDHGIDIKSAEDAFDFIRKITNDSLKTLIWESITNELLNELTTNPPDVETLRIYLVLPLYHEFVNSKNYSKLHTPFSKMLLTLEKIPKKIVSGWYAATSVDYFERLVDIFRELIKYFLQFELTKIQIPQSRQVVFESNFCQALNTLAFLHYVNHQHRTEKVAYEAFNIPEITDYFEIRQDYITWCTDANVNSFYLCNYPFIFDANAKHTLLQTDQAIQMQSAMHSAAANNILSFFGVPANVFIVLNVTRTDIVADTIRELARYNHEDLKKPLKVKFAGEEGEDAGGVRKEFFMLLLRDLLDTKYGMFKVDEDSRAIWFSEDSFESEEMYKLVGILCGLAIYNFTIIDIPFPLALYKKLLNEKPDLSDLKEFSPRLAQTMQNILDYEGNDMAEVMMLNFDITRTFFGEERVYELKPNGSKIPVNQENKKEFVDLYIDYIFNKSVEKPYKGFHDGFMKVVGSRVLKIFKPHELQAVVVGNEDYNWDEFESLAEYKNGYTSSDPTIRMFWEVFHELSLQEKKKFLLFLTGSDRIPIQGMKGIRIYIQPVNDDNKLCVAHTCFNLLDLPRYQSKGKLRYKLLQSIQITEGFTLV